MESRRKTQRLCSVLFSSEHHTGLWSCFSPPLNSEVPPWKVPGCLHGFFQPLGSVLLASFHADRSPSVSSCWEPVLPSAQLVRGHILRPITASFVLVRRAVIVTVRSRRSQVLIMSDNNSAIISLQQSLPAASVEDYCCLFAPLCCCCPQLQICLCPGYEGTRRAGKHSLADRHRCDRVHSVSGIQSITSPAGSLWHGSVCVDVKVGENTDDKTLFFSTPSQRGRRQKHKKTHKQQAKNNTFSPFYPPPPRPHRHRECC